MPPIIHGSIGESSKNRIWLVRTKKNVLLKNLLFKLTASNHTTVN